MCRECGVIPQKASALPSSNVLTCQHKRCCCLSCSHSELPPSLNHQAAPSHPNRQHHNEQGVITGSRQLATAQQPAVRSQLTWYRGTASSEQQPMQDCHTQISGDACVSRLQAGARQQQEAPGDPQARDALAALHADSSNSSNSIAHLRATGCSLKGLIIMLGGL